LPTDGSLSTKFLDVRNNSNQYPFRLDQQYE
jgi:hypothetical protein